MKTTECVRSSDTTAFLSLLTGLPRIDRRFVCAVVLCVAIYGVVPSLSAFASDTAAPAKIAPSLASETALGGSSEALIVFTEQADLSGAANLPTKLRSEKHVYNR